MLQTTNESDRVRANTSDRMNWRIDQAMRKSIQTYAGESKAAISKRIDKIEREWDIERTLELNASSLALTGLLLGVTVNKKWLIVPGVVLPFLFQHAVQGWCPPLPVMRRLGIRTREEIEAEKHALKALRGDFEHAREGNAGAALDAIET